MGIDSFDDITGSVVLITGSTGFIGSCLVNCLLMQGLNVRIYSRQSYSSIKAPFITEVDWVEGELNDEPALVSACIGVDTVFHVAGISQSSGINSEKFREVNLLGTEFIFSAAVKSGVRKFLYFSSDLVSQPIKNDYVESKREAEEFLVSRGPASTGIEVAILRPALVYGAGMRGNLPKFIRLVRSGFLPALPILNNSFSMVSVSDLCKASISIAMMKSSTLMPQMYTITDGERYTPNRIESAIYNSLNRSKPSWRLPRVAFFLAAVIAQLSNIFGIKRNSFGIQLYKNLVSSRSESSSSPRYEFSPASTLETEMCKIIEFLDVE